MHENIRQCVEQLQAIQGETISIEKVGEVVDGILSSVSGDISGADLKIYHQVQALAEYIETTKAEVAQICPSEIKDEHLQIANNELDAIVAHTEEATGAILDSCEVIEKVVEDIDETSAEILNGAVTKIYEACNFQDVTGQRITRVIQALTEIEEKVATLVNAFGDKAEKRAKPVDAKKNKEVDSDKDLLNGPQLPDNAQSQEDIDKLLASFD